MRSSLAVASRLAVGKIGDGGHQAGMPVERGVLPAGLGIPDLDLGNDRTVIGTADRDDRRAIGREGDVLHTGGMSMEDSELCAGGASQTLAF